LTKSASRSANGSNCISSIGTNGSLQLIGQFLDASEPQAYVVALRPDTDDERFAHFDLAETARERLLNTELEG
jgi:hypothetical protein